MATLSQSGTSVTLNPTYEYEVLQSRIQERKRTLTGAEYAYKFGSYTEFNVPVEYVTSADRAQLHTWWNSGSTLTWDDEVTGVATVRMVDDVFPLRRRMKPYIDLFSGKIKLATF